MFDGKAFGKEIVDIVKGHVDKTVGPLLQQIDAMRKEIETLKALPAQPEAVDYVLIGEMVDSAAKAQVHIAIAAIPSWEPKDSYVDMIAEMVALNVSEAVAALPVPKDGSSVTLDEVRPLIEDAVTKAVTLIPVPKDGKNGLDAVKFLRGDKGNLVVTMSNGTVEDLGEIDGRDGNDVDMAAVERSISEKVAAIPIPKNGLDGVGFDDMAMVETDQGVFLRFIKGDEVKDFRLPIIIDRGVFKEGTEYHKGDGVTWGGSFWIAQETTSDKPDSGKGFRLAVKRGRDGKDGIVKPEPPKTPVKVG